MPVNASPREEKQLSAKQEKLILELVAGKTIKDAAISACVNEKTAHIWLKQPAFKSALQAAKQELFDERLDMLKNGISIALKTLAKHMTDEDTPANVQVRAAQIWLEQALEVHKAAELVQRTVELERLLKECMQTQERRK
jgi:phage terminase small subunit